MATITTNGYTWTVCYAGRKVTGFSSIKWAVNYCETVGLVVSDLAGTED